MSTIAIIAALIVGFVVGLLGGGGSIMAVPTLVYLVELSEKSAIATSLFVIGTTSAVAVVSHARAGNVAWRAGVVFGICAMAGAFVGGNLASLFPGEMLLAGFSLIMLLAAVMMLRGRKTPAAAAVTHDAPKPRRVPFRKLIPLGIGVGLLTGLVGAGGGFIVVPTLVVVAGLPIRRAIGTSLLVVTMNSYAGFLGHISHVTIDYKLAVAFLVASIIGSFVGAEVNKRIDASRLRIGFAYFVLIAGTLILGEQLGAPMIRSGFAATVVVFVVLSVRRLAARGQAEAMPASAE
ncbi:sulfite exporter TauE/SafE family protein [Bradymonas sediminis]|uniref:Probable membrane transporter protein n=1 Tax=Bradymonas sediminis TaxID=1548548 RepID=A0A2Z4FND3_9DELT|nr:sulfite exporter TauE/SafE family protein [Bradymonas sediminis]AWV90370.1 sulfite exporter TauE/SafE family protein [Bradymonas sediminis]TDP72246.1 hypothetical protein DFR33_107230 [Bradymonas sediminis]